MGGRGRFSCDISDMLQQDRKHSSAHIRRKEKKFPGLRLQNLWGIFQIFSPCAFLFLILHNSIRLGGGGVTFA